MTVSMNNHIIVAIMAAWGLLITASATIGVLAKAYPKNNHQELIQRTKSWWIMLGVFTLAMTIHRNISFAFLGMLSFLALKEYFSMIPTREVDRKVLLWAYLAIPIQYYLAAVGWYGMFIIFIPVYMFLFIPFRLLINQQPQGFLKAAGTIQWGLMITVFALSHMAYLLALPNIPETASTGAGLLFYLVFLTQFNDVAQYTCGKLFGKHKIIPAISPKKTWEGFIGGMIITIGCAILLYPLLTPFTLYLAIYSGLIISAAGFVGDITISAIKRDLSIKDTGSLIPGHGGILDRIDSLTYAAPIFFHLVYRLYF
ncbi:phosphatidate cytidylyltransferase [Legionella busanensis]|uniref:Phosphatidate cytidylyltransferase n=2 Tax=Legionella TaxID=445 RepID=A0A378JN17_9GAMM|nr:phosphatidate cytidylyltransferase [Legionella busanensis]STX52467.1 phosphatidate cytidylyltransferase [Legionella busanensis]